MTERARITREQLAADPYAVWNAFVGVLAHAEPDDLTPVQLPAFLAFWYEHEVQNGGHYQYFHNRGTEEIDGVIEALRTLSADSLADVAVRAKARIISDPPKRARTLEEFTEAARQGPFDDLDAAFHECSPTIVEALEAYLGAHEADFVERVP